ncbi:hypothetical protein Xedl_00631 [Xenorhabdus eapokensis]|uniref:Uncharacterized protein n=1 Tax=Xenorhabdus eapokensis TaxID=1873482 RepID=A0A1Q5TYU0_9GAMM|nr:hypothetical protein Xedl_00631 [Xenorhabdus eapokensis]
MLLNHIWQDRVPLSVAAKFANPFALLSILTHYFTVFVTFKRLV